MIQTPDKPDGYAIIHNRMTDTLYFGPFKDLNDVLAWSNRNPSVHGITIPLFLNVDWNRRG